MSLAKGSRKSQKCKHEHISVRFRSLLIFDDLTDSGDELLKDQGQSILHKIYERMQSAIKFKGGERPFHIPSVFYCAIKEDANITHSETLLTMGDVAGAIIKVASGNPYTQGIGAVVAKSTAKIVDQLLVANSADLPPIDSLVKKFLQPLDDIRHQLVEELKPHASACGISVELNHSIHILTRGYGALYGIYAAQKLIPSPPAVSEYLMFFDTNSDRVTVTTSTLTLESFHALDSRFSNVAMSSKFDPNVSSKILTQHASMDESPHDFLRIRINGIEPKFVPGGFNNLGGPLLLSSKGRNRNELAYIYLNEALDSVFKAFGTDALETNNAGSELISGYAARRPSQLSEYHREVNRAKEKYGPALAALTVHMFEFADTLEPLGKMFEMRYANRYVWTGTIPTPKFYSP